MYRIAFSWIVATLSQLCRNSIAQLSQFNCPVIAQSLPSELPSCRNSVATRCPPGAQQIAQPEVHCPTVVWPVACLTDFFSIWVTVEYRRDLW